jgi:hypothetical protein
MAARDALERKPTAESSAVFADGFRGIIRTSRKKSTIGPEQRTQAVAVRFDQEE